MPPFTHPISAGTLTSRLRLQRRAEAIDPDGTIVVSWSDIATVWASKHFTGLVTQLEGEHGSPRRTWDIVVRRGNATLPVPLRALEGNDTFFALASIADDTVRDQTLLKCVDGIDLLSAAVAETVTVYRGTDAVNADRSTSRAWGSIETGVRIRMDDAQASLLQRLFGQELAAEVHATAAIDCGIRLGDGIAVTAGRHVGQHFLVTGGMIDPRLPAQAYLALALTATTEAFGDSIVDGASGGGLLDGGGP